ncbi:hypothetical protein TNCV_3704201 [Trichonephila clavipes]|nr:hypothetical protein TNCV_3704201 [Trichonephila clavipes]
MLFPEGTDGAIVKSAALYETAVPRFCQAKHPTELHDHRTVPVFSLIFEGSSIDPSTGTEQSVNASCMKSSTAEYQTLLSTAIILANSPTLVRLSATHTSGSASGGVDSLCGSLLPKPLLNLDKFSFMEGVPSGSSRSGTRMQKCPGARALTPEESADNGVTGLEFKQTSIRKIHLAKIECRAE